MPNEGTPAGPSVSFTGYPPRPIDPGTEATKDIGDGARAPRDSEVSTAGPPHACSSAPHQAGYCSDTQAPRCAPQGPDGAGELGAEACAVHALFLILHSGNILDSGPGDANSKQADVQTLSLAFEAVTRVHFPEALGHVALRLVPCPPICAAAYALVSKYWSGAEGRGTHRVSKVQTATGGSRDQRGPRGKGRGRGEAGRPATHRAGLQFLVSGSITKAPWVPMLPTEAPPQSWDLPTGPGGWEGAVEGPEALPPTHPPARRPSSSSLSPYSHDGDSLSRSQDHIPLAALPLLATSSSRYQGAVATVIARTNQAYAAFLRSSEGAGFCGQVRGRGRSREARRWSPASVLLMAPLSPIRWC